MKLQIAMLVAGMPFDGDCFEDISLGGSETAGYHLGRELAKRGHDVFMFCNCPKPGVYDGVVYYPADMFSQFITTTPHDICIAQRMPKIFSGKLTSKLNILWNHDMALARSRDEIQGVLWNVDRVAVVSEYMAEQYKEVYEIRPEQMFVTRNAVDDNLIKEFTRDDYPHSRDINKLIYTGRPERGLDVLLRDILPRILRYRPETKLCVGAYDNQVEHLREFYAECATLIDQRNKEHPGCVEFLGHMTKQELYQHYATSGLYIYPTPSKINPNFSEVSCITAMECMALGLPFLSMNRGALSETVGDVGVVMGGDIHDPKVQDKFAQAAINILDDTKISDGMTMRGYARHDELKSTWETVAEEWEDMFFTELGLLNADPIRLVRHFIRHSDIMAADYVLDSLLSNPDYEKYDQAVQLRGHLNKHWGFRHSREAYAEQYAKIGETHTDIFDGAQHESRLAHIATWLRQHPEIKTVLDVGCGLGVYSITLSNSFPDIKFTGVDVDPETINWCDRYQGEKAKYPENLKFLIGDEDNLPEGTFDMVLAAEVLEHTVEPWDFLEKISSRLKVGSWCYLTVPYGPWEFDSYETYPHRCHLWEFDVHDMQDMLGRQAHLNISSVFCNNSRLTGDALGHQHVQFQFQSELFPPVSLHRKCWLQRPRQTVSANIIAGGPSAEETILWCLKSIRPLVDELIVVDCGMTDTARKIAAPLIDKIVIGQDPREVGFEVPRNEGLKHVTSDWCLWLDTDEKLCDGQGMLKYLRHNGYSGYGIRQHHLALDTHFDPDMPVRLFRTNEKIRWFGHIHEHPEAELNKGPGFVVILSDVHIAHVGYLTESVRRQRFMRNLPLLEKDKDIYPKRLLQKHFIMRDLMLLSGYELQHNGGKVTDIIRERCQEVIGLYREYFLGKTGYLGIDSTQYYSQALQVLGEGFQVSFDIKTQRDGIGDKLNGNTMWFANTEDLLTEVTLRTKQAAKRFDTMQW